MKAFYESRVTWKQEVDYLRCSPNFYNHPRYDSVLAHVDGKVIFAQLVHIFTIIVDTKPLPMALVHIFDQQKSPAHAKKDQELQFLRLRRQDRSCFIWARSIIQGVPIFPAFDNEKDAIVFDIFDADIFLRVSEILGH